MHTCLKFKPKITVENLKIALITIFCHSPVVLVKTPGCQGIGNSWYVHLYKCTFITTGGLTSIDDQ